MTSTALTYLGWLVESGLWSRQRTTKWADAVIEACDAPAAWVLELSICRTAHECHAVIAEEADRRFWRDRPTAAPESFDEASARALVGMALLRLRRGQMTRFACNDDVLGILDAYQAAFLAVDNPRIVEADGDVFAVPSLQTLLSNLEEAAARMEASVVALSSAEGS